MAAKWHVTTLDKLGRIVTGRTPPSNVVDAFGGHMPFVTPSDMNGARIISATARSLSASGHAAVKNAVVPQNAVMVSCIGSDMGKAAIAGTECVTNQQINSIIVDAKNSPLFVYYNLSLRKAEIRGSASGSAQPILNKSAFGRLEIELPPLAEQRAIAETLGALDDRIDNLRQTNATLQAIAAALFKSRFVDFDGVPPEDMQESELGLIPNGWRAFGFGEIATLGKGTVNPAAQSQSVFSHYSLPAFDAGQMPIAETGEAIKSNKTPVPSGAVLVSKLNPHIPRIWFVGEAGENAVCSTEFLVWMPKPGIGSAFVYFVATSPEFNAAMRQLVTGTSNSHQRVRPEQLAQAHAAIASEASIAAFDEAAAPLLRKIVHNRQQAASLAALRDTLLPRLISGQLRVSQ